MTVQIRDYFRKNHQRWIDRFDGAYSNMATELIQQVEHYRIEDTRAGRKNAAYTHVAVVMLTSGLCFVGVHRTARDEQYSRKVSYQAAVGKALANAVRRCLGIARVTKEKDGSVTFTVPSEDFVLDNELTRKETAEAIKNVLIEGNRFRP